MKTKCVAVSEGGREAGKKKKKGKILSHANFVRRKRTVKVIVLI